MGKINGLRLWYAAQEFQLLLQEALKHFPTHDPGEIRSQLARAADSIPSNIAEGTGRGTPRQRLYFLGMANGSLEETQARLRTCVNSHLLDRKTFYRLWNLSAVMSRMLRALIAGIERDEHDLDDPE